MSKIRRGGHSAEGETLSAGRVEYLEAAGPGAHTAHPPHRRHRSGADHPCPVCHRRSGVFHCARKRPCGYCRHRAGTSRRLAAADRHHRPGCGGADVWQLCGDGRRQLRGIQSWRHPPEQHPERAMPARPLLQARPALCCTTAPAMSFGWKAAPRTFIPKPWTAPSRCAPWQMPDRWLL